MLLSERQKREKEYYDEYAEKFNLNQEIDYSPVLSKKRRPWNSYWSVYDCAAHFYQPNSRLLDFGSGPGDNALRFSKLGYIIEGFDISESNVTLSREIAKRNGVQNQVKFQVSAAEKLPFPDNFFHMVVGIDILHHVDIKLAVNECYRVLKPGGVAVFREPIEVPFLDKIRNTALVKLFAPKEKSFDLHITEDERKLNQLDLAAIKTVFPNFVEKKYLLFARFDKFFREGSHPSPSILEQLDHVLFAFFPFLKPLAGVSIMILRKD